MSSVEHHQITTKAEKILRTLLRQQNYDSVNSLLCFYDSYRRQNTENLYNFFENYKPYIHEKKLTCVGLALELITRWKALDIEHPNFTKSCMLVSCEQAVNDTREYVRADNPDDIHRVDKEHALVCVHVRIDGREGVLLADPGYHLARVVTVMVDNQPPQSDWILQTEVPECRKEFFYVFNNINKKYVEWREKKITQSATVYETALIYVAKPYLEGINVTIRRNLVYEFRSVLARSEKGRLTAGIYFKIRPKENQFNLLIDQEGRRIKEKFNFSLFREGIETPEPLRTYLTEVNSLLGFQKGEIVEILQKLYILMTDDDFVVQLLKINDYIASYCRDRQHRAIAQGSTSAASGSAAVDGIPTDESSAPTSV